jgi:hypothetical protein
LRKIAMVDGQGKLGGRIQESQEKHGALEQEWWSIGVLECWSIEVLEY